MVGIYLRIGHESSSGISTVIRSSHVESSPEAVETSSNGAMMEIGTSYVGQRRLEDVIHCPESSAERWGYGGCSAAAYRVSFAEDVSFVYCCCGFAVCVD